MMSGWQTAKKWMVLNVIVDVVPQLSLCLSTFVSDTFFLAFTAWAIITTPALLFGGKAGMVSAFSKICSHVFKWDIIYYFRFFLWEWYISARMGVDSTMEAFFATHPRPLLFKLEETFGPRQKWRENASGGGGGIEALPLGRGLWHVFFNLSIYFHFWCDIINFLKKDLHFWVSSFILVVVLGAARMGLYQILIFAWLNPVVVLAWRAVKKSSPVRFHLWYCYEASAKFFFIRLLGLSRNPYCNRFLLSLV